MGKKKYVFDSDDFSVGRDGRKGRRFAMLVLKLFLASISLTVIYYIVFALFSVPIPSVRSGMKTACSKECILRWSGRPGSWMMWWRD